MAEIKPVSVPFCDCEKAKDEFGKCAQKTSSMAPTLVKNELCVFCKRYPLWKKSHVAYCDHEEMRLIEEWGSVEYEKKDSTKSGRSRKAEYDLNKVVLPPGVEKKPKFKPEPVKTKKHNPHLCSLCGEKVVWVEQN